MDRNWPITALSALLLLTSNSVVAADEPDWQMLVSQGEPQEWLNWGNRYEHGEGVDMDYVRAVELYCRAARRGLALAQYQLGWMYANGRGVGRDDDLAAAWFRLAASKGDTHAKRMLALMAISDEERQAECLAPTADGGLQTLLKPPTPVNNPRRLQVEQWVYDFAPEYGLDPELVLAVIETESNFRADAISPKNAQGLMQLIPATAERFGVQDTMDPRQNLRGGMAYLRWLLAFFKGDVRLALAGYNAGEGAVERHGGIPPYSETKAYVARITGRYPQLSHPVSLKISSVSAVASALEVEAAAAESDDN